MMRSASKVRKGLYQGVMDICGWIEGEPTGPIQKRLSLLSEKDKRRIIVAALALFFIVLIFLPDYMN